jgi:hypothetical protein
MSNGSGAKRRWDRLRHMFRERGAANSALEILSGQCNHLSRATRRLSARLSHFGAARFPHPWRRAVLARNRELAGSLAGRRAFVVATGPSAARLDLGRLRGEIVIAANESYEMLARHGVTPFAVALIDPIYGTRHEGYERFLRTLADYSRSHDTIILLDLALYPGFEAQRVFAGARVHCLDFAGDMVDMAPLGAGFRLDLTRTLPGMYTVSHAAAAAALGCGAQDVYLLGVDLDYILTPHQPMRHGYGANVYNDHDSKTMLQSYAREKGWDYADILHHVSRQQRSFAVLAEIARRNGQRLANATPGGLLETLPRVAFEGLFSDLHPQPDAGDRDRKPPSSAMTE